MNLCFHLSGSSKSYGVRVVVDGTQVAEIPFAWDFEPTSRVRKVIAGIEGGNCRKDDLRDVGTLLWNAICPAAVREKIAQLADRSPASVSIRIAMPPEREIERLPWESLYDERRGLSLSCNQRYSLSRLPGVDCPPPLERSHSSRRFKILVVVPEGSGLKTRYEWNNLQGLAGSTAVLDLRLLDGRVTPKRLRTTLQGGNWDVLHYIGHGEFNETDGMTLRFNEEEGDGEFWLEAETFAQVLADSGVQLAFLNCCLSASPSVSRSLAGVGPHLTRAGVPAVVAMRYEIADPDAITFANEMYRLLFAGEERGRIDIAVQSARNDLYVSGRGESVRAFVTPVLYLAEGRERLFDVGPAAGAAVVSVARKRQTPVTDFALDDDLVTAFKEGRCIPIVGAGIHAASSRRGVSPLPDLSTILRRLASGLDYPDSYELEMIERGGESFVTVLFSRICQYFQAKHGRYPLVSLLQEICKPTPVPAPLLAVAAWDIPGVVYLHIDGCMEEALRQVKRQPCVLSSLDAPSSGSSVKPLLVNLRGTISAQNTLVLTEVDHEWLYDRIKKPGQEVCDLFMGKGGRTPLFLGVSARDPALRRLCRQLLQNTQESTQGPRYFVAKSQDASMVDRDFWRSFGVHWIDRDPQEVIDALSALTGADAA
jgi:hypothetical protein